MSKLPFGKKNYQWMITGFIVIALGFTFMSLDTTEHGFGFMGLTLGPVVVVIGFALEVFAILQKPQVKN
jgi:membrane-bound ClpP family serine protease